MHVDLNLSENIKRFCVNDHVEEAFTALGEEVLKEDLMAESIISDRLNCAEMVSFWAKSMRLNANNKLNLASWRVLRFHLPPVWPSVPLSKSVKTPCRRSNPLTPPSQSFGALAGSLKLYSGLLDLLQKLRENTRDYTVSRGLRWKSWRLLWKVM